MTRSIVILSGGLDSAVAATLAKETSDPILAITFDYGQRSASREKTAAQKIALRLNIPHKILSIPWLKELTKTSLVNTDSKIPHPKEADLDDPAKSQSSANAVWVPNRNGLFLNIAACYAESMAADLLITGFNSEEGITFPDNSVPFVRAANEFFWYATQKKIKVESPTFTMNKIEIAEKAVELKIPFKELWFCYEGDAIPCRQCESCLRDFRAFREIGITV